MSLNLSRFITTREIMIRGAGMNRILLILMLTAPIGGCASVDFGDIAKTESRAYTDTDDTSVGVYMNELVAQNPGKSAFLLQADGIDALATRILMSARAEYSIDAQYYFINNDDTSRLFLGAMLAAADRGVRVRLLLDDILTTGYDQGMLALDSHPNFEIRLFNPFLRRQSRWVDVVLGFKRVNRRMHNKSFTVDNQFTIIGGRNIGAEYFAGRSDMNFGDIDVAAFGPVVQDVSNMFDRYWNDELAVPVSAVIDPPEDLEAELNRVREVVTQSLVDVRGTPYADALAKNIGDLFDIDKGHFALAPWELVYDDPEKGRTDEQADAAESIRTSLGESLLAAQDRILIVSPYFVPTKDWITGLQDFIDRGIKITVLTNSLAATNHDVVHSGYAPSRKPLLKMGVEIWEHKPDTLISGTDESGVGDAVSGLHTKGFLVDRKELFLGSFNWDPRSAYINTELGIIIKSPELVGEMVDRSDERLRAIAYRVVLTEQGDLAWVEETDNGPVIYTKEPHSTWGERFKVGLMRILPFNSQL
jgi:putative cardiolipin synthase